MTSSRENHSGFTQHCRCFKVAALSSIYYITFDTQHTLKHIDPIAIFLFRCRTQFSFSLIPRFRFHSYLTLFSFFPSHPPSMEPLSTSEPTSNVFSEVSHALLVHLVHSIKIERFSCALQHLQAPCKAVPKMEYLLKHCSSKNNTRTW